tara:strand:+ start:879 stop:1463 length:585 start_codon:yes stop_codon:yes gene_type:complete
MADLITLEDYKEAEGISTPKDDLKLSALIPSVSQLVKTYCGTSFVDHYSSNKIETFSINWNTNLVQLTETPLVSIVSVEERDDYSSSYTTVPITEYFADTTLDAIYRVSTTGGAKNWPGGPASVKITYKAGYDTCPADLKLAVIDLLTYYHKNEHKERKVMAGASIQNSASTSQANNVAFPDHIKRVLDLYKVY